MQETAASDRDDFLHGNPLMHFDIQSNLSGGDCEKNSPLNSSSSEEVYSAAELKPIHLGADGSNSVDIGGGPASMEKELVQEDDGGTQDGEPKAAYDSLGMVKTSEDGYNWRKYGQKQVKGSEYPRSYYKCTNPNCQVKKKVERSQDGQITEIIYKGAHNHPKPQPPRRGAVGAAFSLTENAPEMGEGSGIGISVNVEGGPVWRNIHLAQRDVKPDGLEGTSPPSVRTSISEHPRLPVESPQAPELSSTVASQEDDEDGTTLPVLEEADDDEPDSKRRSYS